MLFYGEKINFKTQLQKIDLRLNLSVNLQSEELSQNIVTLFK